MNDKFDELAKGLAQSVTRRQALRRFGVGIAGVALAMLGLTDNAKADPRKGKRCGGPHGNCPRCYECNQFDGYCYFVCY